MRQTGYFGIVAWILTTVMQTACGGGGSSGGGVSTNTTGTVYPVVTGLAYETDSTSGTIASDGKYSYKANENVTFSIGGLTVAQVPAGTFVTPLPLEEDVASTNLLRLLKALDTDGDLSNGITLPQLTASTLTVDLGSETSVAAALASLEPTASLPAMDDAGVAAALADAKTTALNNMGSYGAAYNAIVVTTIGGAVPQAYHPKDAVVTLTSQPDWGAGTLSGSATLTLNDNSQVTFTFSAASGTYTALGNTQVFKFAPDYGAKSRIMHMYFGTTGFIGKLTLRDDKQTNKPPVAGVGSIEIAPGLSSGQPDVYTFTSIPGGPGDIMLGSKDFDGIIVSQSWVSSKGKTGTGNTFSESFLYGEFSEVTVTVTDDEGATASKIWQINPFGGSWTVTTTGTSNNCGSPADPPYTITTTQSGNSLSIVTPAGTFSGSINGDSFSWSGSYPDEGGTTTINSLQATRSGDTFSGTSNWTWVSGATSCSGTDTFTGSRN